MLEATGMNYQHADQASVPGGSGPTGSVSGEQAETKAGDAPYASVTGMVPPPPKWWLIQPLLNMVPLFGMALTWPTGNSAMMNLTAAQWSNIGRGLKVFEPALQSAEILAGAQDIPEAGQIKKALQDLGDGATKLASIADQLSTTITDFARGVQETQDAIRRLLDRISLEGLWDTVTGFFTGEGENTLRQIANDVGTVLENFQNQLQGVLGLLQELGNLLGEAADSFQKWIRPILVGAFGEDVGNLMADGLKIYTGLQVGVGVAAIGLVSGTLALADPDTWKGMADTAIMIAKDPSKLDDVVKESLGQFLAVDKITGENPERGIGEAAGNIASLFLPGGIFAKGGAVAKGLSATRRLFEKGELGPLERLPGLDGTRRPELPDLPDNPGAPHLPEFTPSPGVPPSVVNPPGGSPGSPNGSPSVRPQTGEPGGPSSTGSGPGAGNTPSPNGSAPHHDGAGPGTPSTGGPAPTGGSPTHGGGAGSGGSASGGPVPAGGSPTHGGSDGSSGAASGGSSSNGPVPTGGSPISGGDAPAGGSHSSPPAESSGSGGPSKSGGGDGPGPVSSGGGSESGGGSHSGGGEGPGSSSESGGGAHNSDDGMSQRPDESHSSSGDGSSSPTDSSPNHAEPGDHHDPVRTHDAEGPGWERLPDEFTGQEPYEPWQFPDDPVDPDRITPAVADLMQDPSAPFGRDANGDPYSARSYAEEFNKLGPKGEHWVNFPDNGGAVAGTRVAYSDFEQFVKDYGNQFDRIGDDKGKYLGLIENGRPASWEERAMHVDSLRQPYNTYTLDHLPEGWKIEVSEIASGVGQPGGGLQVRIMDENKQFWPIEQLLTIDDGVIRR
ncbi:TNT domain-containing protein [Mycolicibacterium neoaurum]|uniref:TNT domain-containing protein n=1 Tax=Mycolicibacterium neoaurum TaxID=1795 RepID=UPI002409E9BA|nr:glycohydrolase toxin TNT-related protein [Mycolicibacterium neoaurum]